MGKIIYACAMLLSIGFLSGCRKKIDVDTSTVLIQKKGKIISVDVEHLDKDYYDLEELERYVTKNIEDYEEEYGNTVKKTSFDVKDGIAKLTMEYDSYEDYTKFNGVELYSGTIVTAKANGYGFDTEFYSVSDSKKDKAVSKEQALLDDGNKVAVICANVDVQVPGTILYVSEKGTEIVGKSTVSILGKDLSKEELTYIIYK